MYFIDYNISYKSTRCTNNYRTNTNNQVKKQRKLNIQLQGNHHSVCHPAVSCSMFQSWSLINKDTGLTCASFEPLPIHNILMPKLCAVRYYLAGTPNFPTSCPSLVYVADMHGIYKLKYPLLNKKTSFEVKHCKIETVVLYRSAQAP